MGLRIHIRMAPENSRRKQGAEGTLCPPSGLTTLQLAGGWPGQHKLLQHMQRIWNGKKSIGRGCGVAHTCAHLGTPSAFTLKHMHAIRNQAMKPLHVCDASSCP
eukprot:364314-Chlamydomonas_euryale.AAC.13